MEANEAKQKCGELEREQNSRMPTFWLTPRHALKYIYF